MTCKHASELMSKSLDGKLSFWQRLSLKLHIVLCPPCKNHEEHFDFLKKASSECDEAIAGSGKGLNDCLSDEAKAKIKDAIEKKTGC